MSGTEVSAVLGLCYKGNTGDVGIGTNEPDGNLHISSGTSGNCYLILETDIDNITGYEDHTPHILFRQDGGRDWNAIYTTSNELTLASSVATGGGIVLKTADDNGGYIGNRKNENNINWKCRYWN